MNREIKFRAWNKHEKKFSDIQFCASFDADGTVNVHYHCEINQFTGLLDKNGKEIYEGDIVSSKIRFYDDTNQGVIDFVNGSYKIRYFKLAVGVAKLVGFSSLSKKYEVIGNIYENPELINN